MQENQLEPPTQEELEELYDLLDSALAEAGRPAREGERVAPGLERSVTAHAPVAGARSTEVLEAGLATSPEG